MKVYPVKSTNSSGTTTVQPFASGELARKQNTANKRDENVTTTEVMETENFELNKTGILEAFTKGQELAKPKAEF